MGLEILIFLEDNKKPVRSQNTGSNCVSSQNVDPGIPGNGKTVLPLTLLGVRPKPRIFRENTYLLLTSK